MGEVVEPAQELFKQRAVEAELLADPVDGFGRGLVAGNRIAGPAVITELSATTYVPSRWSALVDPFGNLTLTPQGAARR